MSAPQEIIAAVDLGSNSFHLVTAEVTGDGFEVIHSTKDRVRLAAGLTEDGRLSEDARRRALDSLRRFGALLAGLPSEAVEVVGTSTLRKARNRLPFLIRAGGALGHPIRAITGRQEALLVYKGVAAHMDGGRRLVVDIGGGSTELVVGDGPTALRAESLDMGCVSFTLRYFPDGDITPEAMARAVHAARRRVRPHAEGLRELGWASAAGSSGTIRAISRILRQELRGDGVITPMSLGRLRRALIAVGRVDQLDLFGLSSTRAPVIAGGVAVLSGVFAELGVERMTRSRAALREGLLYDLLEQRATPAVAQAG